MLFIELSAVKLPSISIYYLLIVKTMRREGGFDVSVNAGTMQEIVSM